MLQEKKYDEIVNNYWNYITYKTIDSYMWNQFFPTTFFMDDDISNEKMISIYKSLNNENIKNIYIHIPFCKSLCKYCYTHRFMENDENEHQKYIDTLIIEIKNFTSIIWNKLKVNSIYIWWWTPNIIWNKLLEKLLICINNNFILDEKWDYNIDLMPYLIDLNTINILKENWVNRINYAVQCFNDDVLKKNNRYFIPNFNHKELLDNIKKSWIEINMDLMVWIDWQTLEDCILDIKKSISLWIKHISHNCMLNTSRLIEKTNSFWLITIVKKYMHKFILKNYNNSEAYYYFENSKEDKNFDLIWFWPWSLTQIHWKVSFYQKDIQKYYNDILSWKINFNKVKLMDEKLEIIRYIWLNIQFWLDLEIIQRRFNINLINFFSDEINYLLDKKIIKIENNKVIPIVNQLKMYVYLSIFFIDEISSIKYKFSNDSFDNKLLYDYFTLDWDMVDWDFVNN